MRSENPVLSPLCLPSFLKHVCNCNIRPLSLEKGTGGSFVDVVTSRTKSPPMLPEESLSLPSFLAMLLTVLVTMDLRPSRWVPPSPVLPSCTFRSRRPRSGGWHVTVRYGMARHGIALHCMASHGLASHHTASRRSKHQYTHSTRITEKSRKFLGTFPWARNPIFGRREATH